MGVVRFLCSWGSFVTGFPLFLIMITSVSMRVIILTFFLFVGS
jgi:hypothetical protein